MPTNFTYRFDNSFSTLRCYRVCHNKCRLHRHGSNQIEFAYVTDGAAKHVLNGVESTISKGDFFAVDVLSEHAFPKVYSENIYMIICIVNIDFLKSSLSRGGNLQEIFQNKFPSINTVLDKNKIYHDSDGSVLHLFTEILKESNSHLTAYPERIECLICEILINMLRSYDCSQESNISAAVQYVIDLVNSNYTQDVSLLEISKELYISHSALSQNFKREVGISFNKFLQQRRIFQACNLLSTTNISVDRIAENVGYSDTKYFRQVFKKILSCTPREFKRYTKQSQVCPDRHDCLETKKYAHCNLRRFCVHYS